MMDDGYTTLEFRVRSMVASAISKLRPGEHDDITIPDLKQAIADLEAVIKHIRECRP
jgi:hypothetical protein